MHFITKPHDKLVVLSHDTHDIFLILFLPGVSLARANLEPCWTKQACYIVAKQKRGCILFCTFFYTFLLMQKTDRSLFYVSIHLKDHCNEFLTQLPKAFTLSNTFSMDLTLNVLVMNISNASPVQVNLFPVTSPTHRCQPSGAHVNCAQIHMLPNTSY